MVKTRNNGERKNPDSLRFITTKGLRGNNLSFQKQRVGPGKRQVVKGWFNFYIEIEIIRPKTGLKFYGSLPNSMKQLYVLLLAGGLFFGPVPGFGQQKPPKTLTITYQQEPLPQVLSGIEKKFGVKIFYKEEWLAGQKLTLNLTNATLTEALQSALLETDLTFASTMPRTW